MCPNVKDKKDQVLLSIQLEIEQLKNNALDYEAENLKILATKQDHGESYICILVSLICACGYGQLTKGLYILTWGFLWLTVLFGGFILLLLKVSYDNFERRNLLSKEIKREIDDHNKSILEEIEKLQSSIQELQ